MGVILSKKIEDNLEYNDGIGDLLREKQKLEFSWVKTTVVFLIFLIIIVGAVGFFLTYGKTLFTPQKTVIKPMIQRDLETKLDEIKPEPLSTESSSIVKDEPIADTDLAQVTDKSKFQCISGTFKNYKNATAMVTDLKKKGISSFIRQETGKTAKVVYKVQTGAFASKQAALIFKQSLEKKGVPTFIQSD